VQWPVSNLLHECGWGEELSVFWTLLFEKCRTSKHGSGQRARVRATHRRRKGLNVRVFVSARPPRVVWRHGCSATSVCPADCQRERMAGNPQLARTRLLAHLVCVHTRTAVGVASPAKHTVTAAPIQPSSTRWVPREQVQGVKANGWQKAYAPTPSLRRVTQLSNLCNAQT
jgi:hypothetical protein